MRERVGGRFSSSLVVMGFVCGLIGFPVEARWSLDPTLQTGITLTDNVGLDATARKGDVITELTPGLLVEGRSSRYALNAHYRVQNLYYGREKGYEVTNHRLDAVASAELFRDRLLVDVEARRFQQPVTAHPGIFLEYLLPGNQADVTVTRIRPQFRQNLGRLAKMQLRYGHERVRLERAAADGGSRRLEARLFNRREEDLAWRLDYRKERVLRAGSLLMDHETLQGDLRYRWQRRFALLVRSGSERHRLGDSTSWTQHFENGRYWAAGLEWRPVRTLRFELLHGPFYQQLRARWRPTRRTRLSLTRWEREYGMNPGESWQGALALNFRNGLWLAAYEERVMALQQALGEQGVYSFRDPQTGALIPGEVDPETGRLVPVFIESGSGERIEHPHAERLTPLVLDDFGLFNETFLRKRAQSVVGWQTPGNLFTMLLFREQRHYLEQGDGEESTGIHFAWQKRIFGDWDLLAGYNHQRRVYRFTRMVGRVWSMEAGISWDVGRRGRATCLYRYLDREVGNRQYNENRFSCHLQLGL